MTDVDDDKTAENSPNLSIPVSNISSLAKTFREALDLEKIDDAELTPDEPYKSKYEARNKYNDILKALTEIEKALDAQSANSDVEGKSAVIDRLLACRATTWLHLGNFLKFVDCQCQQFDIKRVTQNLVDF